MSNREEQVLRQPRNFFPGEQPVADQGTEQSARFGKQCCLQGERIFLAQLLRRFDSQKVGSTSAL